MMSVFFAVAGRNFRTQTYTSYHHLVLVVDSMGHRVKCYIKKFFFDF